MSKCRCREERESVFTIKVTFPIVSLIMNGQNLTSLSFIRTESIFKFLSFEVHHIFKQ